MFESQGHHLCLYQFILELCDVEKTKINKKEAGNGPLKRLPSYHVTRLGDFIEFLTKVTQMYVDFLCFLKKITI